MSVFTGFDALETDEEGLFEVGGLRAGTHSLDIWKSLEEITFVSASDGRSELIPGVDLELVAPELRQVTLGVGERLDLGDLPLVRKEVTERKTGWGGYSSRLRSSGDHSSASYSTGAQRRAPPSTQTIVTKGGFTTVSRSTVRFGSGRKGIPMSPAPGSGHVRIRATDGGSPLAGAVVLLRPAGRSSGTNVGSTNESGELIIEIASETPTHIDLQTANRLYLGGTEVPIQVLADQEIETSIPLRTGGLAIELPESFQAGADRGLRIRLESEAVPGSGSEKLELHGEPSQLSKPGVTWTGNRCELDALAPGHYRILAEVLERVPGTTSPSWRSTGAAFEGEVEVRRGAEAACLLRINS